MAVATVAAVTTDPAGLVALRPLFRQAGLLDLTETAAYDLITCLGNTLPHLRDSIQVADFCVRAARALRPGGRLLLQLMNYDRLVGQPSFAFPDIETDRVVFSRRYTSITNQAADFHIRLLDKATGAGQAASSRLYPIRRSTLASSLAATGFHTVSFCRDYSLTVADGSEPHYLVWAELTV
ncbi:MAG: hypothetical protein A2004_06240 [Spirochaetes bacterium GWC1_61_12]|nr:MAG: hypothetical protein A2004_06240 [Spirochaetes bacterium GWC1_61_12]OHD46741.1 MAG: hypothetical protein A2Y35_10530 [Spirochaetes bacterium GWE1_60_18]OHD61192.1 MAG: hypothetical protein A2Y32_12820 [Spirochaetes bacterium GWF1_60_12]HAP43050.1 hypothetical protein [Spirochaetaceae bacterium]HAW85203.1 hypothetical protein [Spirochaetaceae bacterium]